MYQLYPQLVLVIVLEHCSGYPPLYFPCSAAAFLLLPADHAVGMFVYGVIPPSRYRVPTLATQRGKGKKMQLLEHCGAKREVPTPRLPCSLAGKLYAY